MSWSDVVDLAVIGSSRAPVPQAGGTSAAAGIDPDDDQTRLLHHAAAMSRARRAGYRPPQADQAEAPDPAEADVRPQAEMAAERRLSELLTVGDNELTAEWLRLLASTRWRPPDMLLPGLLEAATSRPELRGLLMPVAGPLASWLAQFNEEWAWARTVSDPDPLDLMTQWETSGSADRRALLTRLRATDPATGRELVVSTWSADSFRDRAAFLEALRDGLSPADEPLAERGLADKRAEVRRAATELITRLPDSRFGQRAAARAAAAVQVERRTLRHQLRITVPQAVTPDMTSDGLDAAPPRGTGADAWLLRQLVAAAPATLWSSHTDLAPAALLGLADRSDWAAPLRAGWADAAIRDADVPWLKALLDYPAAARAGHSDAGLSTAGLSATGLSATGPSTAGPSTAGPSTAGPSTAGPSTAGPSTAGQPGRRAAHELRLISALPVADRDAWLGANPDDELFGAALELVPAPWSPALSDAVRHRLSRAVRSDPGYSPGPRALFRLAATRLEPPTAPDVDPATVHARLGSAWHDLLTTLAARAAMRRELTEEPHP